MKNLRVVGGVLIGLGVSLAGVAALSAAGLFPLSIDFFGNDVEAGSGRTIWIAAWTVVAIVGGLILYFTRRDRRDATSLTN